MIEKPIATKTTPDAPAPKAPPKTNTNWDALTKAMLRPVTIYCQTYPLQRNMPYRDMSCHSRLPLTVETMEGHTLGQHGGGFLVCVKQSDAKASPLWANLDAHELEAIDFRCAACDKAVALQPNNLSPHLRPHAGMTKQAYADLVRNHPGAIGFFNVTLRKNQPPQNDEDDEVTE